MAEGFYNAGKRHSALGNVSPGEYEEVRSRGRPCKSTTLQIIVPSQIVFQDLFEVPLLLGSEVSLELVVRVL